MFRRAGAHGWNINASSLRPAKLSTYYCNIDWIDDFLSDLATLPTQLVSNLYGPFTSGPGGVKNLDII